MKKRNVRLSLEFTGEQIRFLERLSLECRHNGGTRFSYDCILRSLIRVISEFDAEFIDSECEEKLFRLLVEEICEIE
jgi:hypothetical protein